MKKIALITDGWQHYVTDAISKTLISMQACMSSTASVTSAKTKSTTRENTTSTISRVWKTSFQNAVESLYARLTLKKMNKRLSQLYIRDSFTGLYNRMAYDQLAKPLYRKFISIWRMKKCTISKKQNTLLDKKKTSTDHFPMALYWFLSLSRSSRSLIPQLRRQIVP